jgi:hypothetical protein
MKTITVKNAVLLAIAMLFTRPLSAGGQQTDDAGQPDRDGGKETEVSGTVRTVGSMPFTELVVTDGDGTDWFIDKDEKAKLSERSGQRVRVRGRAYCSDLVLANGSKAGVRRTLKNVEILPPLAADE